MNSNDVVEIFYVGAIVLSGSYYLVKLWLLSREVKQVAELTWDVTAQVYRVNVQINWRDDFQKNFATLIKSMIPSSDRSYDPSTKTWYFHEKWFTFVHKIVETGWPNAFVYTKEQAEEFDRQNQQQDKSSYHQRVHSTDQYITTFVNLCMKHGITGSNYKFDETYKDWNHTVKLYRRASMTLHPDRNPNGAEDMSRLNEAWSYIKADKEEKEKQNAAV